MLRVVPKWRIIATSSLGRAFAIEMDSDFVSEVLKVAAALSYKPDVYSVQVILAERDK